MKYKFEMTVVSYSVVTIEGDFTTEETEILEFIANNAERITWDVLANLLDTETLHWIRQQTLKCKPNFTDFDLARHQLIDYELKQ